MNADVYAIKFGEHIEFRTSKTPPKAKVSKLTKTVTHKDWVYVGTWPNIAAKLVDVPTKFVMSQTFFVGGRVIGYLKGASVSTKLHLKVPKDKCVRLSDTQAEQVRTVLKSPKP